MRDNEESDDLQSSLTNVLFFAQFFGLFPLTGIKSKHSDALKFEWRSKATIFSMCLMTFTAALCLSAFLDMFFGLSDVLDMSNFGFYFNCTLTVFAFLKLARRWPAFIKKWNEMEHCMNIYETPVRLKSTFTRLSLLFLAFATVEHILCVSTGIYIMPKESNRTSIEKMERYFASQFPFVYAFIPCPIWFGFILKILATINTVAWNFPDLFIMLISIALAKRFEQLNLKIKAVCTEKVKSSSFWSTTRLHYNVLVGMCRSLDKELQNIIMISFGNNMSYILFQMYGCLRKRDYVIEFIYFVYSFVLILGKLLFVCLYASKIHDESIEALGYMYPVQYKMDNEDLDLLVKQMQTSVVALSGRKMFYITRSLVFALGGALLTYELFLYQYTIAKA